MGIEEIKERDVFFKDYKIFVIEEYSNSGMTYYGKNIFVQKFINKIGRYDKVIFEKYVSELTNDEFLKYEQSIEEVYVHYKESVEKENLFKEKRREFILKNKHLITYPFYLFDKEDSRRISFTNTRLDGEVMYEYKNESELFNNDLYSENYTGTHVLFAFIENSFDLCGYEVSDYVKKLILK